MFVALDSVSGKRLTSISEGWVGRPDTLRSWTREGRLLCPGCSQPLWFRVGETRRPHFAHRQSSACPLAHDSSEVREAKAKLYEWLESKFPGKVELDHDFGKPENKFPADLFVAADEKHHFGYWVFDRAKRDRHLLFKTVAALNLQPHIIHTEAALSADDGLIHLTASQRDFASASSYDAYHWPGLGHLHFLDSETGELRIYRGLHPVHPPAGHRWEDLRSGLLSTALISSSTGEPVFAEDDEARRDFREEVSREELDKTPSAPCFDPPSDDDDFDRGGSPPNFSPANPGPPSSLPTAPLRYGPVRKRRPRVRPPVFSEPGPDPEPEAPSPLLSQPLRCEDCGCVTSDWSEASPGKGTCVCRSCVSNRHRRFQNRQG